MLVDNFSANLRELRTRRRLTQVSLAAKTGMSVSYVSMLERGTRTPALETIEALAEALVVAPLDLLQELRQRRPGRMR